MNASRLSRLLLLLMLLSPGAFAGDDSGKPLALATQLNCQPPTRAPAANASQDQFDQYSWQLFIALNWPAQDGQRGTPNCSKQPGDPHHALDGNVDGADRGAYPGGDR